MIFRLGHGGAGPAARRSVLRFVQHIDVSGIRQHRRLPAGSHRRCHQPESASGGARLGFDGGACHGFAAISLGSVAGVFLADGRAATAYLGDVMGRLFKAENLPAAGAAAEA